MSQEDYKNRKNIQTKSVYSKRYARAKTKEIQKKYSREPHNRFYYLIKGFFLSLIISVPIFFIIAYAMKSTNFPEKYMPPALLSTILISIVISSFYATASAKATGWFNGTLVGFFYMFLLVIIRWCIEKHISFNKEILTMLLAGLLIGSVCGIAGLNLSDQIRKYTGKAQKRST